MQLEQTGCWLLQRIFCSRQRLHAVPLLRGKGLGDLEGKEF